MNVWLNYHMQIHVLIGALMEEHVPTTQIMVKRLVNVSQWSQDPDVKVGP